jgi:hypothetical protein
MDLFPPLGYGRETPTPFGPLERVFVTLFFFRPLSTEENVVTRILNFKHTI